MCVSSASTSCPRRRGHIYHTNVYDLETRELIWSAEGRSKDTLKAFFAWLGEDESAALEGICCDMWANYIDVVKEKAPQAMLVFDKFHIMRHLLRAVNDVRKMEQKALREAEPELLKGTRYIWLKNPAPGSAIRSAWRAWSRFQPVTAHR